jgi:hypothetical protein
MVAVCDRARELHHPVPERLGLLLRENEESRRDAGALASGLSDPVTRGGAAPGPLVAAIEDDLRQRMRDEPQLLDANLVSDDDDDGSEPA